MVDKKTIKELEKKREKYLNAVLDLSLIEKEQYELELKHDEAIRRRQKAEWEYWKMLNKINVEGGENEV